MCFYGRSHKLEQYRDANGLHYCLCYEVRERASEAIKNERAKFRHFKNVVRIQRKNV